MSGTDHLGKLHAVECEMRDWARTLEHVADLLDEVGLIKPARRIDAVIARIERQGSGLSSSYMAEVVERTRRSDLATADFVSAAIRRLRGQP